MPQLIGKAENGYIVLKKSLLDKIAKDLDGHELLITIDKHQPRASRQARSYYFAGVVTPAGEKFGYEKEEMHDILKLKWNGKEVADPETGEIMMIPGSTKKMKKLPFWEFTDKCARWLVQLGVPIKSPEEYYNSISIKPNDQTTNLGGIDGNKSH
jgi:hypothetical protein